MKEEDVCPSCEKRLSTGFDGLCTVCRGRPYDSFKNKESRREFSHDISVQDVEKYNDV